MHLLKAVSELKSAAIYIVVFTYVYLVINNYLVEYFMWYTLNSICVFHFMCA